MISSTVSINVIEEIAAVGGYHNDPSLHFEYQSGKHGDAYLNMDPLFPFWRKMSTICRELSYPFVGQFDAVVGSATGGIPIAAMIAEQRRVPIVVWADKIGKDEFGKDIFAFERAGFAASLKGRSVLYVEDILNTGSTSAKTIELIKRAGGTLVGASCACNRGDATKESLGVPELHQLSSVSLKVYEPEDCPGCKNLVPMITNVGHGDRFQAMNPSYGGGFRQLAPAA